MIEPQYARCHELWDKEGPIQLGRMLSQGWRDDPKRLAFTLARYKFVSKMLTDAHYVAEVGCGDGFASEIVERSVKYLDLFDLDPSLSDGRATEHDIAAEPLSMQYDAVYSLDVIEHIPGQEALCNLAASLKAHGTLILGAPSLESQGYASPLSAMGHVNCRSGEQLRRELSAIFRHVFIFGMNDEMVHVGFLPMCHYLLAVCCEPIR